jgi:catechol 2,3-dioxygenase-like lactoylglutathione lyase family enzyme
MLIGTMTRRKRVGQRLWRMSPIVGACGVLALVAPGFADYWLQAAPPAVIGLDHVPIAVADLDAAAADYRALGFTLKPGTVHDNGLRNEHAKFVDGTELELITAPAATDSLTTTYRQFLRAGDGPAFLALFMSSPADVAQQLATVQQRFQQQGRSIDIPNDDPFGFLFFGRRNASPTDRPEHFQHPNSGESFVSVWLAPEDPASARRLFTALGAAISPVQIDVPSRATAEVARFAEGDVILLPLSSRVTKDRPIVGVTVRVRSLQTARNVVLRVAKPVRDEPGRLVLPPAAAHGTWLEQREGSEAR